MTRHDQQVYDLFMRQGYQCNYCGAFRVKLSDMRKHIRTFHNKAIRDKLNRDIVAPYQDKIRGKVHAVNAPLPILRSAYCEGERGQSDGLL